MHLNASAPKFITRGVKSFIVLRCHFAPLSVSVLAFQIRVLEYFSLLTVSMICAKCSLTHLFFQIGSGSWVKRQS